MYSTQYLLADTQNYYNRTNMQYPQYNYYTSDNQQNLGYVHVQNSCGYQSMHAEMRGHVVEQPMPFSSAFPLQVITNKQRKKKNGKRGMVSGNKSKGGARENIYLNKEMLENLKPILERKPSKNEEFISKIKEEAKNEEYSTASESSLRTFKNNNSKCAPPRKSRAMNFVNKDIDLYREDYQNKYKTELCRNWELTGYCKFSKRCAFAHGSNDMKDKIFLPNNYKTKPCKQFNETMYCPYGSRCQFLHSISKEPSKRVSYIDMLKELNSSRIDTSLGKRRLNVFKMLENKAVKTA